MSENDNNNNSNDIEIAQTPEAQALAEEIKVANMPSNNNPWANESQKQGNEWKYGPRTTSNAFDGGTDELTSGVYGRGDFSMEIGSDEEGEREGIFHPNTGVTPEITTPVTSETPAPITKEKKELTSEEKELKELKRIVKEQSIQIQQLITVIQNNVNIQNNTTINPTPAVVEPPVNPVEPTPTPIVKEPTPASTNPELVPVTAEQAAKERRLKNLALVAGIAAGGATGILGGIPAAAVGGVCLVGAKGLSMLTGFVGSKAIDKLDTKITAARNAGDHVSAYNMEKRKKGWEKVQNGLQYVNKFLLGYGIGLAASSFVSAAFMGSHGLVWNTPEPTGIGIGANPTGPSHIEPRTLTDGGNGVDSGPATSPETYQGNDFIDKNGVIHANGSPWDSTQVAQPVDGMNPTDPNSYVQGPWGKTPSVVENFLRQHNVTDTSYLNGYDRDRILDETWLAIKDGNTNPDMVEILKHVGTEGTTKLLTAIGQ